MICRAPRLWANRRSDYLPSKLCLHPEENSSEKALTEALAAAVEHIEELEESDRAAWEKLIYYMHLLVHHRRKPQEGERLKAKIRDGVRAGQGRKAAEIMARNLAEQYMEEGEKRGIEKGRVEGIKKGRVEGMVRAKQDDLIELMAEKFGTVPDRIISRVRSMDDTETLGRMLKRLVHAATLEAMGF